MVDAARTHRADPADLAPRPVAKGRAHQHGRDQHPKKGPSSPVRRSRSGVRCITLDQSRIALSAASQAGQSGPDLPALRSALQ